MPKQFDLPQSPLRIDLVVESIRNLLYGDVLGRLRIQSRANDAVCAFADGHDGGLVLGGDLEDVAEDVILNESAAVAQRRRNGLRPHLMRRRWLLGGARL